MGYTQQHPESQIIHVSYVVRGRHSLPVHLLALIETIETAVANGDVTDHDADNRWQMTEVLLLVNLTSQSSHVNRIKHMCWRDVTA